MQLISRNTKIIFFLLISILPQVYKLFLPVKLLFSGFLPDDAFYYYKVAINIHNGQGITFDGNNITNGFHPLWMFICVCLTGLTTDLQLYLYLVLVVNLLLVLGVSVLVFKALQNDLGDLFALALLCVMNWNYMSSITYFSGLETPLYLLMVMGGVILLAENVDKPEKNGWLLGLLLAMAFLARTEFVLFIPVLIIYILLSPSRWNWFRPGVLILLILPGIILALPYLIWNYSISGNFQQISGLVKDLWGQNQIRNVGGVLINYLQILQSAFNPLSFNSLPAGLRLTSLIILLAGLIYAASAKEFLIRLVKNKKLVILLSYAFVLSLYYLISYGLNIRYWHLSVVILAVQIVFVYLLKSAWDHKSFYRAKKPMMIVLMICILLGNLGQIPYQSIWFQKNNYHFIAPVYYMDEAVTWIKGNLPEDAVIGVWDAGYVGYFSERQVINLDGLINGKVLYDYLKNDPSGVWAYILDQRIEYISNYYFGEPQIPDWMRAHLELIHNVGRQPVVRNGVTTYVDWYVWKVKP